GSVRSQATADAPVSRASASSRSARRATPTTSQPCARSARTVASPIPVLAPVTTARLFTMPPPYDFPPGRRAFEVLRNISRLLSPLARFRTVAAGTPSLTRHPRPPLESSDERRELAFRDQADPLRCCA